MKNFKKIFSALSFVLVVVLCAGLFVGCGAKPTGLSRHMITLEYAYVEYDGTAKKPAVKVKIDGADVSVNEFVVEYTNNVNVGVANVKVSAVEDSKVLSGSVTVAFEIKQGVAEVATFEAFESCIANANYKEVVLTENITIPAEKTITIADGMKLSVGDKVLTNNGKIVNNGEICSNNLIAGAGEFENNAEYVIYVDTYAELVGATHKATTIVLTSNIVGLSDADYELYANATVGDLNLVLDLNGNTLESSLYIVAKENKKMNLTIKNGTIFTRGQGSDYDYAIAIKSKAQNKGDVVIKVEDVVAFSYNSGIQTNGSSDQKNIILEAKNCKFGIADGTQYGYEMTEDGGYFPGLHDYKFENCEFVGRDGYYAKSGFHKVINCQIKGVSATYVAPSHNGNGCNPTGSAIVVDSSQCYQAPVEVELDGCTLTSVAGFAVEEIITYKTEAIESYSEITYKNNPVLISAEGKDPIAPLYVMDITQVSISAIETTLTGMGTAAATKGVDEGSYTLAQFEQETESEFDFYIYVGDLINDVVVHTFSCDNVHNYKHTDKTNFALGGGVVIADRAFYVDADGKAYVAASVIAEEFSRGEFPTNIYLNGKPFPIPAP